MNHFLLFHSLRPVLVARIPGLVREKYFGGLGMRLIGYMHMQWYRKNWLFGMALKRRIGAGGNFEGVTRQANVKNRASDS